MASYREMLLHDFVSQLRDGALGDDAAPIQDREIVGQLPAEFQILLHQKDRDGRHLSFTTPVVPPLKLTVLLLSDYPVPLAPVPTK